MGVRILTDTRQDYPTVSHAVLYCSTADWAFGPVFYGDEHHDADDRAQAFLRWMGKRDPRGMTDTALEAAYVDWRLQEDKQWAAEAADADLLASGWAADEAAP